MLNNIPEYLRDFMNTAHFAGMGIDALQVQLLHVLCVIVGAACGLCLVWFGARKISGAVMSALKKGSLRF